MKINEALIIGGSLLAALVLFKGGAASSNNKQFSGKSSVPVLPIENKGPSFQIPQIQTFFQIPQIQTFLQKIRIPSIPTFEQFFPVTDTNVQLKQIANIEKEKKDQRISYLQNELDQTREYIDQQQPRSLKYTGRYNPYPTNLESDTIQFIQYSTGRKSITDQDIVNYYEEFANNPFHKSYAGLTNYYDYIISTRNITKAEVYADRQQEGINLIEKEYQTRFGGLSRYG